MEPINNNKRDLRSILPQHQISDDVWGNIEQQLTSVKKMPEMPQYVASENLWDGIAQQMLAHKKIRRRNSIRMVSFISGIAASLVLIMYLVGAFENQQSTLKTVVIHTEELVLQRPLAHLASMSSADESENIIEHCTNFPNVCVNPEFVQLKSKWQNLKNELTHLKLLSNAGNNKQVGYYITRIEMDIKQLENKMMHMFMS